MFEFAWPWLALLLPLPWLMTRLPGAGRAAPTGDSSALLNPSVAQLRAAFGGAAPGGPWMPSLAKVLLGLFWGALVVSLMRPQWLERHTEVVTPGYDLMLAVDTSRSMEALDFNVEGRPVNRLAVVKGVVGRFIEQRRGDRIGLVLFGDGAYLQSPLTLDGAAVRALLDNAVPRMAGEGTAIGDAIGLAAKKLRERPEGSRVLVLLTDGENTAGTLPPLDAAYLAREFGVRVYTIGVGSKGKVPIMEDGRLVMADMQIDEDLLRQIALVTRGAYFRATDSGALEEIYARVDALEKTEAETRTTLVPTPLFRWPLGFALLTLLMLGWLAARRGAPPL